PTWQYTTSVGNWFEYVDSGNLTKEGIMSVEGICGGSGDPGGGYCGDITTNYDGGNRGSEGGAVYFDISVKDEDIDITAFDLNTTDVGNAFTVDVYTLVGSDAGNEGNHSLCTLR